MHLHQHSPLHEEHQLPTGVCGTNNPLWLQTSAKPPCLFSLKSENIKFTERMSDVSPYLSLYFLCRFTSSFFLLLPRSSESPVPSVEPFLLPSFFFSSFSLCFAMNSAMRSGQSKFSSGSHVLSSLQNLVILSTQLRILLEIFILNNSRYEKLSAT